MGSSAVRAGGSQKKKKTKHTEKEMAKSARKSEQHVPRKRHIKEAPPPPQHQHSFSIETGAVLTAVAAFFIGVSLLSAIQSGEWVNSEYYSAPQRANIMGPFGARLAELLLTWFGWCSFVAVGWLAITTMQLAKGRVSSSFLAVRLAHGLLSAVSLLVSTSLIAATLYGLTGGGRMGAAIALRSVRYLNEPGTLLLGVTSLLLCLGVSTGLGIVQLLASSARTTAAAAAKANSTSRAIAGQLRKVSQSQAQLSSFNKPFVALEDKPFIIGNSTIPATTNRAKRNKTEERLSASHGTADDEIDEVDADHESEHEIDEGCDTDDSPHSFEDRTVGANIKINRSVALEAAEEQEVALAGSPSDVLPLVSGKQVGISKALKGLTHKFKGSPQDSHKVREIAAASTEFVLPAPELLVRGESIAHSTPQDKELVHNSKRLEQSLQHFRIGGRVIEVQPGPVITLYEFEPAPGVKVQRIIALADDLALALKVASVRVYAPVPGKGTVGIEVPNPNRDIVRLRDLIETDAFQDRQHQIALALGKDTFGDPFVADLAKMPHLLIAGATGTGKSVCINSLLLSLLYRNSPDELRLLLIDPKMLELSVYEDIPQLLAPVVTQAKRARGLLWWAVEEMERRYSLMKDLGVRNLASYNALVSTKNEETQRFKKRTRPVASVIELTEQDVVSTAAENAQLSRELAAESSAMPSAPAGLETLPRIVIVVDELADLMLTVGREIEELLTRLAQKARAAGIHLILATQRPSVNVITGLIKANFPSRISFKVATRIDSRTVLDGSGAEKLLGQGDMLFLTGGAGRPKRLHSPFVSDKEVHDVVTWLKKQGRPDYDEKIESMIERMESTESSANSTLEGGAEEYDALYDQALNLVVEKGFASTSMVQRVFRIGYNRAARILETMEREGVVGPADGAKPRQILLPGNSDI